MTPTALVTSAMLLGAFVLAGGGYGGLYGAGLLARRRGYLRAGYVCYGVQVALVVAILSLTPLATMWKALIVVSCAAYGFIPPVTWRYLEQLHESEKLE